ERRHPATSSRPRSPVDWSRWSPRRSRARPTGPVAPGRESRPARPYWPSWSSSVPRPGGPNGSGPWSGTGGGGGPEPAAGGGADGGRRAGYAVQVTGLLIMLGVLGGDLPKEAAEPGAAEVLNNPALRTLVERSRDDLLRRVRSLLEADAARFFDRLAGVEAIAGSAQRLRAAPRAGAQTS